MRINNQKGVALIVALIVIAIVGIIAVSLASNAYRSQRSENISVSNSLSTANAISGTNHMIGFLTQMVNEDIFDLVTTKKSTFEIGGSSKSTANIFGGVEDLTVKNSGGDIYWYRKDDNWGANCISCVEVSNTTTVKVEYRGATRLSPSSTGQNLEYRIYRITSRGLDNAEAPEAETIVQTQLGILREATE